jgi:hypothetical protein
MRPSFWCPQQPPLRVWMRRPLMSSFPDKDRASYQCLFIHLHLCLFRLLQLHPELRPALVSQQPPLRRPQQTSHPHLFRAMQQRPLRPPQRPSFRPMLRASQQPSFRPLPG